MTLESLFKDLQADTLTAYSDLIIGVSDLAERLKTDHDVERTLQSFRYPIASETLAQIPSAIEVRLPEIDEIVIWLSRESDSTHPMLSVEFTNKDSQITLSRDGAMFTGNEHDPDLQLNSDKTLTKIPLVESGEVNKLLMSLMFPRSDGLYPALDDLTLLKPDTFDVLSDALSAQALGGTSVREYKLKSSEAYFIHSTVNGKSASFSLQYVDQVTARPIIIQSDMLTDFQLKFFTLGEDEDSYKTPRTILPQKKFSVRTPFCVLKPMAYRLKSPKRLSRTKRSILQKMKSTARKRCSTSSTQITNSSLNEHSLNTANSRTTRFFFKNLKLLAVRLGQLN